LPLLPTPTDNAAMETGPHKAEPPKRKRRWFQFSLRTLMVLTLVCAIPFAWLGRRIEQKRGEREAVAAIVKLGGSVSYDYEKASWEWEFGGSAPIGEVKHAKPPGPDWLRNLLGENFFSDVYWVVLSTSDGKLENLKQLTQLKKLQLTVSDGGLENLKGLTQLQFLHFSGAVTDADLENLKEMHHLKELSLNATKVTDAGLTKLKGLTHLESLGLGLTKVTDAGVKDLQTALPNCNIAH
jgi:Leucine-rich repeat (LRR) protein